MRVMDASMDGDDVMKNAIRHSPLSIVLTDPRIKDNPITYVNSAFEALTLYSRRYAVGRNCRFLQGPETEERHVTRIRDGLKSEQEFEVTLTNHRADGSAFRNQLLIVLPDTSKMAAEVKVNEALSGRVQAGQRTIIRTDALPDQVFEGIVRSVGVLAEDGGWRDPNRRDYTVRIDLDDIGAHALTPSMRCTATILVDLVADALFVPVHAVQK